MRLINADKIDFGKVFIGGSDFAKDTREAAQKLIDSQSTVYDGEEMAADIDQTIEYFKGELSQMDVFSDIVSFREAERKSIETALKILQSIQEESQTGQQAMFDIAQITVSQNMAAGQEEHYGGNKDMPGMRQGIHRPHQKVL